MSINKKWEKGDRLQFHESQMDVYVVLDANDRYLTVESMDTKQILMLKTDKFAKKIHEKELRWFV